MFEAIDLTNSPSELDVLPNYYQTRLSAGVLAHLCC